MFPTHIFHPPSTTIPPTSLAGSTSPKHVYVSTPSALSSMATKLKAAKEIAVDLEHHSYRTYRGFLCLMQISTREEDFIIDLLVPNVRDSIGNALGEIFSDPEIVKVRLPNSRALLYSIKSYEFQVFHGAESDIVWLQQDFNIFVVGLFDTYHASKVLDFQKHGLANLLEAFCDFIPDKRYQLADWRIRYVGVFFSFSKVIPSQEHDSVYLHIDLLYFQDDCLWDSMLNLICSILLSFVFIFELYIDKLFFILNLEVHCQKRCSHMHAPILTSCYTFMINCDSPLSSAHRRCLLQMHTRRLHYHSSPRAAYLTSRSTCY